MMLPRGSRLSLVIMSLLLILLQFYVRPRLWDTRFAPDFLLILLLVIAMVSRPGVAALAGLAVGLVSDALTPVNIGAGMLAHAVVGYLAAWSRVVFFGENYLVHLGLFLGACWVRNVLVALLGGLGRGAVQYEAFVGGLLQGLTTAIAGVVVIFVVREWMGVRLEA